MESKNTISRIIKIILIIVIIFQVQNLALKVSDITTKDVRSILDNELTVDKINTGSELLSKYNKVPTVAYTLTEATRVSKKKITGKVKIELIGDSLIESFDGEISIKFKEKKWSLDKVKKVNEGILTPSKSAGDSFLDKLRNDIYEDGIFIFNDKKYGYTRSYVDKLAVMAEEGNTDNMVCRIATYKGNVNTEIIAIMKFNWETLNWDLVDFKQLGGI